MVTISQLDQKIEAIIDYLYENQEPEGSFPTLRFFTKDEGSYLRPSEFEGWYHLGNCSWLSAAIGYHLCTIDSLKTDVIRQKICEYLLRITENGLARFEPSLYKPVTYPTDMDDTAHVYFALNRNGYQYKGNEAMVFANTDGAGNFYTWVVPRFSHLRHPKNLLWVLWDFAKVNFKSLKFGWSPRKIWTVTKEYWYNTEPAISANVILSLGLSEKTKPYLDTLIQRIESDDVPLQYYGTKLAPYLCIARMYAAGIKEVGVLQDKIIAYIDAQQKENGEVEGAFNTAMAALTLIYFERWDNPVLYKALEYLAGHEMHSTGWLPMHFANDVYGDFRDGGAEMTATFFLEALYHYREHLKSVE